MRDKRQVIIEKQLKIKGDYQFKALNSKNFIRSNWHNNKLVALDYIINPTKYMKILDLGSGSGNFEIFFAKKVSKIIALDYHDDAVNFLKKLLKRKKINNVSVKLFDITNLENFTPSSKFDFVVLCDVIEHLHLNNINTLIKNLLKLVNPDGKVVVVTPNYRSSWIVIEKLMDIFHISPHLKGDQHLFAFDQDSLKKVLKKNGFKIESINSFNLFSFLIPFQFLSKICCLLEIKYFNNLGNLLIASVRVK